MHTCRNGGFVSGEHCFFPSLVSGGEGGGESPGMGGNLSCTTVCSQREATEQNVDPKHKIKTRKRAGEEDGMKKCIFGCCYSTSSSFHRRRRFPSFSPPPLSIQLRAPRCSPIPRKKEGEEEEEGFSIRNGIPPPPPPPLTPPPPPPIGVYNSMRGVL